MLRTKVWSAIVVGQAFFVMAAGVFVVAYSQQFTWLLAHIVGEERYFGPANVDKLWEDGHWEVKIPESFNLFNLPVLTAGILLILAGLTMLVLWRNQPQRTARPLPTPTTRDHR